MNLSETEPLQGMLPSRASDKIMFEGRLQELSVLRRAIKAQLESVKIGDVSFFKVLIHEDDLFQPADAARQSEQRALLSTTKASESQ